MPRSPPIDGCGPTRAGWRSSWRTASRKRLRRPLLGEPWPTAGLLLFYADIDPEYVDDLLTGAPSGEASPARVFGTQAPVAASAPPTLTAFAHGERQVAPRAVLTLPDGFEAWRLLGIEGVAGTSYDEGPCHRATPCSRT
jgi:hypothetical protein